MLSQSRWAPFAGARAVGLGFVLAALFALSAEPLAQADGCYACASGSALQCRGYCRYQGADTFDARRKCKDKGCTVTGATACPQDGKAICRAPAPPSAPAASSAAVALAIPWCAAPARS